jgi:demethylmenaquinone methyltransferase / 2-methoxy-6-polyprenyl-1,4-benzoquinol methylase
VYGDLKDVKPGYVRRMFAAIAGRYDLMNRLMTGGRDEAWRRAVVRELDLQPAAVVIDVATGTGDIARQVARTCPGSRIEAVDFCAEMMLAGRPKFVEGDLRQRVTFICGDALALPYADDTFDGATTGFALRNVASIPRALSEMRRVLKPGARMVCLEISRPAWPLISRIYWWYFFKVVPLLGGWISGQREAYSYLPRSAQAFLTARQLATEMEAVGFRDVRHRLLLLGAAAIHVGTK